MISGAPPLTTRAAFQKRFAGAAQRGLDIGELDAVFAVHSRFSRRADKAKPTLPKDGCMVYRGHVKPFRAALSRPFFCGPYR
jgi:hypothetical protein